MAEADRTITILHLEDNPLDAELTWEMLVSNGISCGVKRIFKLVDFRQALQEYTEEQNIDLVLADYNMPGFDGLTALKMTRQVDPDLPFILLSGALGEEPAVELLRSGATDYVLKNNMQRLPLVVTRAIEEYEVRQREKRSQAEIRNARDEAQKANSAKSRFLGRISHELRTPLNAIIGYTQLMQSDPMSEEQQHCTEQILKAGEHLLQLINEVLDITRIESGVIPLSITPTPIVPIIERSVDLLRPMARDNNVTISIDGGPCDLQILADKDRLAQVLINLISNAVKYNRENGYVFVECQEERPGFVKILVRDTGIGIPPAKMDRLFTPFDRLDLEISSAVQGTGLGLTVSKSLIEAMGGMLGVVSSEDEGSIFWLEVPSEHRVENMDNFPTGNSTGQFSSPTGICKVLLVEDHGPAADFLERALKRRGNFVISVAASTGEALKMLDADTPDVIIADLNLPDKPGEDLIREIRNRESTADISIIVLTADTCTSRETTVKEMGSCAYFTKPVKVNLLVEQIVRVLNERCKVQ